MKAIFTEFKNEDNWVKGKVENYDFEAKLYDGGSESGINEGRVSKLILTDEDDNWICNYDRGWDVEPEEKYIECYNAIMELLENAPKRFS